MTEVENLIHKAIVDSIVLDSVGENLPSFVLAHLRATPDCVIVLEKDGRISFMSENGQRAMDVDDFRQFHNKLWWSLWPNETHDRLMNIFQMALTGQTIEFEASCPTFKGHKRCWKLNVSPIRDYTGQVESVLVVSRDVVDPKKVCESCSECIFETA